MKCSQPALEYMSGSGNSNRYKQMHRWLLILGMLSTKHPIRMTTIRKRLGVSLKTIHRDLQFLEHWVPLVVTNGKREGKEGRPPVEFQIIPDHQMPEGLIKAIDTAYKKISRRRNHPWRKFNGDEKTI